MPGRRSRNGVIVERLVDPERELALSYTLQPARDYLRALWLVDERFGAIVAGTTDPMIGEMRLLWWREALATVADEDPAEPLLQHVKRIIAESGGDGSKWGAMAEGWHALLQEPLGETELDRFAKERGGRLFRLSANLIDSSKGSADSAVELAGMGWALIDLSFRHSNVEIARLARRKAAALLEPVASEAFARRGKSLGALLVLARRDVRSQETKRRQASPSRVLRMLSYRLFGR